MFQSGHFLVHHACGKRRDIFKGENGIETGEEFIGQSVGFCVTFVTNHLEDFVCAV